MSPYLVADLTSWELAGALPTANTASPATPTARAFLDFRSISISSHLALELSIRVYGIAGRGPRQSPSFGGCSKYYAACGRQSLSKIPPPQNGPPKPKP